MKGKTMRMFLATLAIIAITPTAFAAGNVTSTYGTTNLSSTNWSATDCNGESTILRCTLNGSEAPGADMGDNGKH